MPNSKITHKKEGFSPSFSAKKVLFADITALLHLIILSYCRLTVNAFSYGKAFFFGFFSKIRKNGSF